MEDVDRVIAQDAARTRDVRLIDLLRGVFMTDRTFATFTTPSNFR